MRKLILFFSVIILSTTGIMADTKNDRTLLRNAYSYNNSFIFIENGITFSVYPDGEFDFYINNQIGNMNRNITFNSGFDYSPYAQYDDYGAVIQVENVPVYYDFYGRVSQIGSVDINYRNGRVRQLGGMFVYYNNRGFFDYHTGFINVYNRNYIYRPFHRFFARPSLGFCLVYNRPYRRYYNAVRYTYYNPYRYNVRRAYATIGREHRYNRVRRQRASIYRNDKRVAVRTNRVRRYRPNYPAHTNRVVTRKNNTRTNRTIANNEVKRSSKSIYRGNENRTNRRSRPNHNTLRKSNAKTGRTVTQRKVIHTPSSRTVKKTTTYKKPQSRNNARTVTTTRRISKPNKVNSRMSTQKLVSNSPSRRIKKAPVRSIRNTTSISRSSRSRARF